MAEVMTDEMLHQIRSTYGAGKPANAGVPTAFRELLGYIEILRAQLAEARAQERERCAQRALQARTESGANNAVFAHGWDAGCAWTYNAIRALSQEKKE